MKHKFSTPFLDFLERESKNLSKPLKAVIGLDPAIGVTGYSVLIIDNDNNLYCIDSGFFKTNTKLNHTQRITQLYESVYDYLHETVRLLYYHDVEVCGVGLEIPAVFLQKNRFSRDLVQRDAVTACRLAVGTMFLNVAGDETDKPVRPNQIHALGGANKRGIGKGLKPEDKSKLKKTMVKNALEKMCIMYKTLDKLDESDALGCAVVAWKNFYVKLGK